MIIGITGTLGAGKGTIVDFLKTKGFKHYSAREDVINKEILKRGLEINRDNMVMVANDMRAERGPSAVAEILYEMANDEDAVLESLRTVGEIESLRKKGEFVLFAVDADRKTRFERINKRANVHSDGVDFQKFSEQEETEMKNDDPNKQNLSKCISMADYKFDNDGTIEELYEKVEKALEENENDE